MTDRTGTRRQDTLGEQQHYPSWPFCFVDKFLEDFSRYVRDRIPSQADSLSPEEVNLFNNDIPQYIKDYVSYRTNATTSPQKLSLGCFEDQPNYPLQRFIGEMDGPFSLLPRQQEDPRLFITQTHKTVHDPSWLPSGEYAGVSLMETTREKSHGEKIEKFSASSYSVGSGVENLQQTVPQYQKVASNTCSSGGIGSASRKGAGGSSVNGGHGGRRLRRGSSFGGNQAGRAEQAAPARRPSQSSKASAPRGKKHICPECQDEFPFDARLRSHMAVHRKPGDKLRCPDCGSEFGRDSSLKRHKKTLGSCQKKKQTKLRASSLQGTAAQRSGSQNSFDGNTAASVASSYHGMPMCNNHGQARVESSLLGGGILAGNHAPENSRSMHTAQYTPAQYDRSPAHNYQQGFQNTSHLSRNPHRGESPQAGGDCWIDPGLPWTSSIGEQFAMSDYLDVPEND